MSNKSNENSSTSNYWTEDRINKLKTHFEEGLSGTKIANLLGDGITRSAVMGKLNRMGLKQKNREVENKTVSEEKPAKEKSEAGKKSVKKDEYISTNELIKIFQGETEKVDPNKPVTIMSLTEKTCRWPIGDPFEDDFHFCGKDSEDDAPYCKEHSEISYQPIQKQRRDLQPKRAELPNKK